MRKNILGRPTGEVETHAIWQKMKAGCRQISAALAREHDVELLLQRMQMKDIRRRVRHLRVGEFIGAPVGQLLLFRQINAEDLTCQILEAMLVGICARETGGYLCAVDGRRHYTKCLRQDAHVEAGEMEDLEDRLVRQHP